MSLPEILALLYDYRVQALLWTVGYLLLYALAANLLYRGRQVPKTRLGRIIGFFDHRSPGENRPIGRILASVLGFLFFVGVPYLALITGVTNPRLLGLHAENWIEGVGLSILFGLGGFITFAGIWLYYLRALSSREARGIIKQHSPSWPQVLIGVLQLQVHWAFLRTAPLLILGDYYGVFAGLGLFFLEGLTNPLVRKLLAQEGQEEVLWLAGMAILNTVLFYITRNLWLSTAVHLGIELSLWGLFRKMFLPPPTRTSQQATSS